LFDPVRLELKGNAFPAVEGIALEPLLSFQVAAFSASAAGHIIYRTGPAGQDRRFVWFDRFGKEAGKVGNLDRGVPLSPAVSPDGNRVALHRTIDGNVDIWILDLGQGGLSRFTTHTSAEIHPLWSVDGSRILFNSNRTGSFQLREIYAWNTRRKPDPADAEPADKLVSRRALAAVSAPRPDYQH
jgi:dipeptidyl aminopeptidase/acylaminoacyl peptidase